MEWAYDDILGLQRPVHDGDVFSRRHPKMTRLNRAKIFAPFAALTGFEEAVRSKQTPYVPRRQPDAEGLRALNRALRLLERAEAIRLVPSGGSVALDGSLCGGLTCPNLMTRKVPVMHGGDLYGDRGGGHHAPADGGLYRPHPYSGWRQGTGVLQEDCEKIV